MGRRGAVVTRFGVRLPAGWVRLDPLAGVQVAALPAGDGEPPAAVLTVTPAQDPDHTDRQRVLDRLRSALPVDLLVVDEGPARCRHDVEVHRMLTAHTHDGRGVTTELWLVAGERPAVLCAAVDTARYAELGPVVQRMLRSFSAGEAGPPRVSWDRDPGSVRP